MKSQTASAPRPPGHIEGQARSSQLMSPGRFIHLGLHPSTNMIMTGENTFVHSLRQLFSLKPINVSWDDRTSPRMDLWVSAHRALGEQQQPCQVSEMLAARVLQKDPHPAQFRRGRGYLAVSGMCPA